MDPITLTLAGLGLGGTVAGLFMGCRCGCGSCEFGLDDFSDTDLSDWTAESGVWSVTTINGKLNTTDVNARLIWNTPASGDNHSVEVLPVTTGTPEHYVRLFINYASSDVYYCGEIHNSLTSTDSKMAIYRRDGGAEVLIAEQNIAGLNPFGVLTKLCFDESKRRITFQLQNSRSLSVATTPLAGGDRVGIGTGSVIASTFHFDTFRASMVDASCTDCEQLCANCGGLGAQITGVWQVDLEGIAVGTTGVGFPSGICATSDCERLNGTFIEELGNRPSSANVGLNKMCTLGGLSIGNCGACDDYDTTCLGGGVGASPQRWQRSFGVFATTLLNPAVHVGSYAITASTATSATAIFSFGTSSVSTRAMCADTTPINLALASGSTNRFCSGNTAVCTVQSLY